MFLNTNMCGIFALIEENTFDPNNPNDVLNNYKTTMQSVLSKLNHRGPDGNGNKLVVDPNFNKVVMMLHTRLKINGDDTCQPLVNQDNTVYLVINGEIFNWKSLEKELDYKCTKSDCEILFPLYEKYKDDIPTLFKKLKGQFSFFLYDLRNRHVLIGRDPIGVTPLYVGYHPTINRFVVSSELKCLTMTEANNQSFVDNIKVFYPRKYLYTSIDDKPLNSLMEHSQEYTNFYTDYNLLTDNPENETKQDLVNERDNIMETIRQKLTNGVKAQLEDLINSDSPEFGVLLSGGLDSSLIASLVVSLAKQMGYDKKVKTFSVGINKDVPDLVAAREVASFLNTDHHEFYFTIEQGLNEIENVIWHTESYDCTTIRASTAMFLLTKAIKQKFPNNKVLFSGELSDELLCYLYGANAPSEMDFQTETLNLVSNVHLFDCLRANKMCMAHSMEARVPFTDIEFVKYILSLHPRWKIFGDKNKNDIDTVLNGVKMEKQILRDSFKGYLPNSILYRKKEQFSDGVSGFNKEKDNWIDAIKNFCDTKYNAYDFDTLRNNYTYNRPDTKEKLYYREVFCKLFNNTSYKNMSEFTVKTWEPKWSDTNDPSGRSQTFWQKN